MNKLTSIYIFGIYFNLMISGFIFFYHWLEWLIIEHKEVYRGVAENELKSSKNAARFVVMSPLWFIYLPYKVIRFAFSK